ncbi:MAG: LysM peptidoglycan-binding domain-containing protein [Spirochaetes bacterium]|nr:LysM peptidoglycan-binding domain-containing protein [Spirochaetota bacterium]MBN2771277.1 LysM peptidoglycan-binding domain-containing protein [Spirochaetota bacterium]
MTSYKFKILDKYITRTGDTLYRISNMYFLQWSIWPAIYRINEAVITNQWDIEPGLEIVIPNLNTTKILHKLVAGDDYFTLAHQYYGTMDLYYHIQKENNHEIITAGNTVTIPALVSERDMHKAKELRHVCA